MTREEEKLYSYGRLSAFCDDNAVSLPPCHMDIIYNIFDSYNHTEYRKSPLEKLQKDFPFISNENLLELIEYFKKAVDYCETVCCTLAGIYDSPCVPETDQGKEDIRRVVEACTKRYPWMKSQYIESLAVGVVYMCWR